MFSILKVNQKKCTDGLTYKVQGLWVGGDSAKGKAKMRLIGTVTKFSTTSKPLQQKMIT